MADPALLAPSAVDVPAAELHEATVLDDATEPGQPIRCTVASLDPLLATDRMPWQPYVTAGGFFYPKQGDRAVLSYQIDGTPVIVWWVPSKGAEPDVVIESGGGVSSVFGRAGAVKAQAGDYATGDISGLTEALAAKQPLDSDLTAIAALAPGDGATLVRSGGSWAALAKGSSGQQMVVRSDGTINWTTTEVYATAWGLKADGVTDDTTALQAAVDVGPNRVVLPSGTTIYSQLTMRTGVWLQGAGSGATVLKRKNGSNKDSITVENYGANGIYKFGLEGLSMDGNLANNEKGSGLVLDGLTFTLRDLLIYNNPEAGIKSKKSRVAEGSEFGYMDVWVENVKVFLNTKGGIEWEGPHDSHFTNCQAISNHTFNFRTTGEGFACKFYGCHGYGDAEYPFQIEAGGKFVNCEAEGGSKAQVALFSDNIHWLGGTVFQDTTSGTDGKIGFQFGRTAGEGGEKTAFNTQIIGTRVNECDNGAFKLANGWSGSRIHAYVYATKNKAFVGTAPTQGQLDCLIHLQGGVEMGIGKATDRRYADSATDEVLALWVKGDVHPHLIISPSKLSFGAGESEPDAFLERSGSNALTTPGKLTAAEFKTAVLQKVKGSHGPAGSALNNLLIALAETGIVANESVSATLEVASASTISLGENCPALVLITGETEIKKISATNTGHLVMLKFAKALTVKNGENLKLGGDYVAAANSSLLLICDGTNWYSDFRLAEALRSGSAAGGSLSGTYPNPGLAENSVGATQIAANAVGSSEIGENAVEASEIAAGAVGSSELATGAKELFPQWPSAASRTVNRGNKTEVAAESDVEIEHGLGAEPACVSVTLRINENLEAAKGTAPYLKTASSTKLTIRNPSNKKVTVYWWATT